MQECILNQTRGYWLLSDALVLAMMISKKLDEQQKDRLNIIPPLTCRDQDVELEILYGSMVGVREKIIQLFLAFAKEYDADMAHNIIAIMLDPHFKGLQCLIEFVGEFKAKEIVLKYNYEVLILALVKVFDFFLIFYIQSSLL